MPGDARQTMAIPPEKGEFFHQVAVGISPPLVPTALAPTGLHVATCRSVRPQKLCSCGFYWLEWYTPKGA